MEPCSQAQQLQDLEDEIQTIVKKNNALISLIMQYKESTQPLIKKVYRISPKAFLPESTSKTPYSFECQAIELSLSRADVVSQWIVPINEEKPQEVDPDRLLYGDNRDLMDMTCDAFDDIVRINNQISVCMRYLSLLRESAAGSGYC